MNALPQIVTLTPTTMMTPTVSMTRTMTMTPRIVMINSNVMYEKIYQTRRNDQSKFYRLKLAKMTSFTIFNVALQHKTLAKKEIRRDISTKFS